MIIQSNNIQLTPEEQLKFNTLPKLTKEQQNLIDQLALTMIELISDDK